MIIIVSLIVNLEGNKEREEQDVQNDCKDHQLGLLVDLSQGPMSGQALIVRVVIQDDLQTLELIKGNLSPEIVQQLIRCHGLELH